MPTLYYTQPLTAQEKQRAYAQGKQEARQAEKARRAAEKAPPPAPPKPIFVAPPSRRGPRRKKGKTQTNANEDDSSAVPPPHPGDARPQNRVFCRFFRLWPVSCSYNVPVLAPLLPLPTPPTFVSAQLTVLLPPAPPALPVFSVFSIFDTSLLSFEDSDPLPAPAFSTNSRQDEVYFIKKYDNSRTRDIASLQGTRPWSRIRRRNMRLRHYAPPFMSPHHPFVSQISQP